MTGSNEASLVSVFTSPVETDAEVVRNMLVANDIHATVAESNGPFAGLLISPSEVLVWRKDETLARSLIALAESRQRSHLHPNAVQSSANDGAK